MIERVLISVSVVLAFAVAGYFVGVGATESKFQKRFNEQSRAIMKLEQNLQRSSGRIVARYVDRVQTITKEVPVYVSHPDDCQYLPYSFVQFSNASAGVSQSDSSGNTDGASGSP